MPFIGLHTATSKMTSSLIGRQAVVVGAGMAGLPAARALADYFEQVTVLERDALPADASPRIGTPQSRHTRALLGGGQRTLSELFPGFEQDLRGAGAVPYRAGLDVRFERPGFDPFPQRDLGWIGYAMSRPLIERTVRRHVERQQNITIRAHCRARELVPSPDGTAVSAIHFANSDAREVRPSRLTWPARLRDAAALPWRLSDPSASRRPKKPSSRSISPMLRPLLRSQRMRRPTGEVS